VNRGGVMHARLVTAGAMAVWLGGRSLAAQTPLDLVQQKYEADPQHSAIEFVARILRVVKVPGRFRDYSATIIYDPVHPERSSVVAVIVAKSIDTDMAFRDTHLRSPDFIDAGRYPLITFRSDSVRRRSGGLSAIGPLTVHGVTRVTVVPITVVLPPDTTPSSGIVTVAFEATLQLSRRDFAIAGSNQFNPDFDPATNLVGDNVDVILELMAQRQGYRDRHFHTRLPPSVGDTLLRAIKARGLEEALRLYAVLRASQPQAYDFDAGQLDLLGHLLAEQGRLSDAVKIFQLNAQTFPDRADVFDALGEADCVVGDRHGAELAFERAAQLDSTDTTPIEMLRRLRALP
jgi:polyisoprenoid-binding protein YceI